MQNLEQIKGFSCIKGNLIRLSYKVAIDKLPILAIKTSNCHKHLLKNN